MKEIMNQDIVITGLQSWDIKIGSNCKNIAGEFSKKNRVLYVNPPMDRLSAIRKRKNSTDLKSGLKRINEQLWVYYPEHIIESISRLPFNRFFDALNKRNNRIFARDILKAIKKLDFNDYIHFCDSDMFRSLHLKELLQPKFYIYYTRDNLMAVDYWKVQGTRIEPQHMAKADLVAANSDYLARLAGKHNTKSIFVGQGCDLSAFKEANKNIVPKDIAHIKSPIIGYIGALKTLRLDIGILEYIADKKPNWNIVLVGPEDEAFLASSLHNKKNVWFLGSKQETELPNYLNSFDVAINPQVVNEVTIGNYPRKIDEYLAMGKPVVGTKTLAMEYFKAHISMAETKEEWVSKIQFELEKDNSDLQKSRIRFASEHTWENSVNQIYKHISKINKHEIH